MAVDTPSIAVSMDSVRQQFTEQINFFRQKLNLPTERWDDIRMAAHDKAFIVAGAQKADLLVDLRAAVDKAVTGQSIGEFRKDFAAAVAKSGWSGWTGEGTKAGEAWRTRVIYQTNIATSYAAGRWQQLKDPDLVAVRPFWQYIHSDSVLSPRPLHLAWGNSGLTLPNDHPSWKTHFPPNGWGCKCRVKAVRGPAKGAAAAPPDGWDAVDPKTDAPFGIDKGWGYAPGQSAASTADLVNLKVTTQAGRDEAVARAYTEQLMADGAYQNWYDSIERRVKALAPKTGDMNAGYAVNFLRNRKNIPDQGAWPVAVLSPDSQGWFGVDSAVRTVNFSTDTAIKQIFKRGDDFKAGDYKLLQEIMDSAELVTQDRDLHAVYFHRGDAIYTAVLKVDQQKQNVFLQTFHRSSQRDFDAAKRKGRVLRGLSE